VCACTLALPFYIALECVGCIAHNRLSLTVCLHATVIPHGSSLHRRVAVQEQHKLSAVADWEHKTDIRIKALNVSKRFEALKDRRQAGIERRQHELADKLAMEEYSLQQELLSSQTTPEQRRAELTARARSLAARREAERLKLAEDLYEQQFRENCDLL